MSLFENIEVSMKKLQEIFDKKFGKISVYGDDFKYREILRDAISVSQDIFNYSEMGIDLLNNHPDSNPELVEQIRNGLFGPLCGYEEGLVKISKSADYQTYVYIQNKWLPGGINVVISYLQKASLHPHNSVEFARNTYSAMLALQPLWSSISRLHSRLQWTVMYPDSFSRDSVRIQSGIMKQGYEKIWIQFSNAIEEYLSGKFQNMSNSLRNALTLYIKEIARLYSADENQFGTQRANLVQLGFMDNNFSDTLSKFYGHLSKFCKGHDAPSALEAQFLLDMAMSVFGFLVNRVNEFSRDKLSKTGKSTKKKKSDDS